MPITRVLSSPHDLALRGRLLAGRDLDPPGGEDLVLGLFEDDKLVATGSLVGNTLQGMAVAPEHDGKGLLTLLISELLTQALPLRDNLRVFTRARSAAAFAGLGFTLIASTDRTALLEWRSGLENARNTFAAQAADHPGPAGAVVVNANPFTLGHLRLIETAAAGEDRLYVLVVEEDRSEVPFSVRLRLVREGLTHLPHVRVISGSPYVISAATFPAYFTRRADQSAVHAELDLRLFASLVAPALRATTRYVGSEPFCAATAVYNEVMTRVLPPAGVRVVKIPRFELNGSPVSASAVRALWAAGRLQEASALVPPVTREWLASPQAKDILEHLTLRRMCHEGSAQSSGRFARVQ